MPRNAPEVGNALVALVRRRRADYPDIERAWRSFLRIPLAVTDCDMRAAPRLATETGLYAYDAFVIEAARAAGAPLMTLDEKRLTVAAAHGIEILELT